MNFNFSFDDVGKQLQEHREQVLLILLGELGFDCSELSDVEDRGRLDMVKDFLCENGLTIYMETDVLTGEERYRVEKAIPYAIKKIF